MVLQPHPGSIRGARLVQRYAGQCRWRPPGDGRPDNDPTSSAHRLARQASSSDMPPCRPRGEPTGRSAESQKRPVTHAGAITQTRQDAHRSRPEKLVGAEKHPPRWPGAISLVLMHGAEQENAPSLPSARRSLCDDGEPCQHSSSTAAVAGIDGYVTPESALAGMAN